MKVKQYYKPSGGKGKRRLLTAACVLLALAILGFAALEWVIYSGAEDRVEGEPEIMVIFGCKVEPWGPSVLLQDRLDKALEYLWEHPEMTVIVTGGKGDDEHMSEARCMYDYLVGHGVDPAKIHLEHQSRNTWQNVNYTRELMQSGKIEPSGKFLLVSSGFHLTRIRMLWERGWEGTYTVSTLAAPVTHVPSAVKMFFREPLALVKSYFVDK